jgi:dihydrodipicolinate synthase/N-acetylneuraminate lyase
MLGILDNTTVRAPLLPIAEAEHETIRHALQSAGLLS